MGTKRVPARDAVKPGWNGSMRIEHAYLDEDDIEWLAPVERLTLWNVLIPQGFLAKLDRLWWLDIPGGSATDISIVRDARQLRFLGVMSVRGTRDVAAIAELPDLRFLQIGGLHQVKQLPSFTPLDFLERVEIGPMRGLTSLAEVLDAPALRELLLVRKISVSDSDVDRINSHPTLTRFYWFAEDVPVRAWLPVTQRIKLPQASILHVHEWFEKHKQD